MHSHAQPTKSAYPRAQSLHARSPSGQQPTGWTWLVPAFVSLLILLATVEPAPAQPGLSSGPKEEAVVVFCYGASRAICQRFPRHQLALRSG